jgi:short-subunit dehydrogenase
MVFIVARRNISDLRIVITGASSGLGQQLAMQLDRLGARLLLTARRADRLQAISERLEKKPLIVAGDITSGELRTELIETCQSRWQGLDILINNAGVGAMGTFATSDPGRLRKVMEVNFFAAAEMMRLTIPLLKKSDSGAIVNISSVLGHTAVPEKSEYCASKFALHGFSDSVRGELAESGIDLLLISPSTIKTDFFESAIEDTTTTDWDRRPGMSAEYVAGRIIQALRRKRREVILPVSGKFFVWLDRLMPTVSEWLIRRFLSKQKH